MSRPKLALLLFAAWTLVGLYFATQAYYNPAFVPRLPWSQAILINLTYYYLWGLCTPLVIVMARRFRFDQKRWPRALAAHIVASCVLTALQILIAEALLGRLQLAGREGATLLHKIGYAFGVNFHSSLPTYWLILFITFAVDYYTNAARLRAQLSEASLRALKMQLNPHFLFNTLNSISSLMYSDVESADAMLARLSEFLRMTLDRDLADEIPLEQEIEFVRRYLEIEKIRFDERLQVRIDVARDVEQASVPSLALQPLVENAIHHGIAPRPEGGAIEIRAHRLNGNLHLSVADDGLGSETLPRERIGLANTRARLEQLYGSEQTLSISNMQRGGFRVDMVIPYHEAP